MSDITDRALDEAPLDLKHMVWKLIGCHWGSLLSTPKDRDKCPRGADQIVVLHHGEVEMEVRLCAEHFTVVQHETTPRGETP